MTMKTPELSRRSFVKAGGALAVLAAAGGAVSTAEDLFDNVEPAHAAADDQIVWSQCNVNCGGRCVFQWHVRDGKIAYMLTDDTEAMTSRHEPACAGVRCVSGSTIPIVYSIR